MKTNKKIFVSIGIIRINRHLVGRPKCLDLDVETDKTVVILEEECIWATK